MGDKGYWLIEGEHAKKVLADLQALWRHWRQEAYNWARGQGGDGRVQISGLGTITGICFDREPFNSPLWKHRGEGVYAPRRNSRAAKALSEEMHKLRWGCGEDIGRAFLGQGMLFAGSRFFTPGLEFYADAVIVLASLPPADNEEQWQPIEGLRRLKDSEYWQIREAGPAAEAPEG